MARAEDLRRSTRATTPFAATGEYRERADALNRLREHAATDQALDARKTNEKAVEEARALLQGAAVCHETR